MSFRCPQCDKVFSYGFSLQTHVKVKHAGVRYQCDKCIKIYTSMEMKRRHMEEEHSVSREDTRMAKIYGCPECGKAYAREDHLQRHREAEHYGAQYTCQFCSKVYKYKAALLKHVNRKHQEQKFKYEELLKQGKEDWKYAVDNKVPLDVLPEERKHAVQQYLLYMTVNKHVYGDAYFRL